jgi:hypothetical protein
MFSGKLISWKIAREVKALGAVSSFPRRVNTPNVPTLTKAGVLAHRKVSRAE